MPVIPEGLPTIGKATLTLLKQKGITTAADVVMAGSKGDEPIPGLGPARWAVLEEWATSHLDFDDRLAIVEGRIGKHSGTYYDLVHSTIYLTRNNRSWQEEIHQNDLQRRCRWICDQPWFLDMEALTEDDQAKVTTAIARVAEAEAEAAAAKRAADAKERAQQEKEDAPLVALARIERTLRGCAGMSVLLLVIGGSVASGAVMLMLHPFA